jgi:GDPmannose 4,6-dehydratase
VAKAFAHFTAINYRVAYGMYVATVILFNHESPLRPPAFVTRKITTAAVAIAEGRQDTLELGRLDIRRDWGAAAEYTRAMHAVISHDHPDDFCIATGVSHELGEFVEAAFHAAGVSDPWRHVVTNPAFVRPNDIPETRGDPSRAGAELGWQAGASLAQIAADLVAVDRERLTGPEHDRTYLR